MMMTFTQAGAAEPVDDRAVNEGQEDYTRIGDMAKAFGVMPRALRFLRGQGADQPEARRLDPPLHPPRQGAPQAYPARSQGRFRRATSSR